MTSVTIEVAIDVDGNVDIKQNPLTISDGDTLLWHVESKSTGKDKIRINLPQDKDSPFANTENLLELGIGCNAADVVTEPVCWPEGVESYSYQIEISGGEGGTIARGTLLRRENICVEALDLPDTVTEIYLLPPNPVLGQPLCFSHFKKIYPLPWWRRWCGCWSPLRIFQANCCCCCCDHKAAPVPQPIPQPFPQPIPQPRAIPAPTIVLSQGNLAIGGMFYLLITPQGNRCQFVVQWAAAGGVGQLTVNLDVQDPGAASFRRLATGMGPTDQYTFVGNRSTYLFRATVTDSRGQSTFDTLSVACP